MLFKRKRALIKRYFFKVCPLVIEEERMQGALYYADLMNSIFLWQ
jgi:hypothetical protein